MITNSDNLEFQIIDFALKSNNEKIKKIMEEILSKYSYQTEELINDTAKYLNETTPFFWEKVIIENNYEESFKTYNTSIVNKGEGDTYTYHIYKGKKKSKTLRCANTDTYYKIAEKKIDYIPKRINVYNENYYDTITYNDLLTINIYSSNNKKKNIDFVKNALTHTYKEKISEISKTIVKEFYDRILPLQPIYKDRLKEIEQIVSKNQYKKERIEQNSQAIEQSINILCKNNDFTEEKYYQAFRNIDNNREYIENIILPSRSDIKDKIKYYNENIKELKSKKLVDESVFNFDVNEDGKKGWNWEIKNYITNDILSAIGTITTFKEAPKNLLKFINIVNKDILPLSIQYDHNPIFNEKYHNYVFRYHKDDEEKTTSIKSYESGILNIRTNNKKISISELLEIIHRIKKLANKVLKENVIIDVYNTELINDMKDSLREDIGLGDKGLDYIEDWEMEPYNWKLKSKYNKENIDKYVKRIIQIINDIEEIIKYANENEKKAIFFKEYTEYYKELCNIYNKYYDNIKQIKNNNNRINEINKENENLKEEYIKTSKILEEISNYQNIMKNTKILQKKEV